MDTAGDVVTGLLAAASFTQSDSGEISISISSVVDAFDDGARRAAAPTD